MTRFHVRLLAVALVASVAGPAFAQIGYSDGYEFLKAVRARDGAKVMEAVGNPAFNPNHRESGTGDGALHILVRGRDLTWLRYLLGHGARPDLQNNEGTTPLLLAAQIGWVPGAEVLLARSANPNLGNNRGETPLILAVQGRHLPMVRLLLSNRADPNRSDSLQGYSAIDYARQDPRSAQILRELEAPRPTPANPPASN
ncbi:MAG TPA: ankyrin repeat domain-containing protein [Allosphingosinicella sp.]|nr:ankyrin repeat domain-containing protein [Allosphingosinicella sp.]